MVTPRQIAERTMTPEKRKSDSNNYLLLLTRPVSYVIASPLIAAGIRANTVSLISIFISIGSFLLVGLTQNKIAQCIGIMLFFLWGIMDCVDGDIARYTGQASSLGKLWDAAAGYAAMALMYLAMGLCTVNAPMGFLNLHIPDAWYVALAALTALSTLYTRLVMHKKMLLFSEKATEELTDKANYSIPKIIVLNLTNPAGIVTIIMLAAVLLNCTREFTIAYFLLHAAIAVVSMRDLMKE